MPLKLGIIVESSMIVTSYMWMPNVKLRFLCFEVYHSLAVCYSILPMHSHVLFELYSSTSQEYFRIWLFNFHVNQSSTLCRLLDSLTSFTNNLKIPNTTTATFTRKTYALQVNDIDTSNFQGQTFSVDLGSVKEAMNSSTNIREEAIDTVEGNKVLQNRTASVQVPVSVFQDLGQSGGQQRLSYSVFVRDTLFQSSDENQSNLTVGSIIVAVRVNGTTASGNLSTPINVTFQASEVSGYL